MIVKLMAAISQVESGDDDEAVGSQGERGRFQLSLVFWIQWAPDGMPFQRAHCRECAETVVMRAMKSWTSYLASKHVRADLMPSIIAQWFTCGLAKLPSQAKADEIRRILALYGS